MDKKVGTLIDVEKLIKDVVDMNQALINDIQEIECLLKQARLQLIESRSLTYEVDYIIDKILLISNKKH